MSVVELKSRQTRVHDSVVARLEEWLEMARKGEVVMLALAGVNDKGELMHSWSETYDFGGMLGSIARLQHRLNVVQDEAVHE